MARKRTVKRTPRPTEPPISQQGSKYTEEQRLSFLARAQEIGIPPACAEFGWPSEQSGYVWARKYGVTIDVDPVRARCVAVREAYSTIEKLEVANAIIRAVAQRLRVNPQTGEFLETVDIDGMEINRLSSALDKAVKITELLEGRPTEISETVSELDADLRRLVTQLKSNNDDKVAELRS